MRFITLFIFFATICSAQVDLDAGLIAHFPFSGSYDDLKSNLTTNIGTNPPAFTNDMNGVAMNAIAFDGIDDLLEIEDNALLDLEIGDEFALSMWIKPATLQANTAGTVNDIFSKWSANLADPYPYTILYRNNTSGDPGTVYFQRFDSNASGCSHRPRLEYCQDLADDWHHLVIQKQGTFIEYYIDGALADIIEDPTTCNIKNGEPIILGARQRASIDYQRYYTGSLDELRIYDRALNIEEIHELVGFTPTGSSFTADILGNIPPLCEGECTTIMTDAIVDIEGGVASYDITIEINWDAAAPLTSTTFTKTDANSIHAFRICHDNTVTNVETSTIADDITVFNVPSAYFPGEMTLIGVEDNNGCFATITQNGPVQITSGQGMLINYQTTIPNLVCDSLILPDIIPFASGAAYYSEPMGTGFVFAAGQVLDATTINLPNGDLLDSLYIFNPNDGCASQKLLSFMIQPSPKLDTPRDTALCGTYILPPYSGAVTTPNAQYASSINFETSTLLNPSDPINTSQRIYLRDRADYIIGECVFLDSFDVNITSPPFAGLDTTVYICSGTTTIISDPFQLLRGADTGGTWSGTQIPDVDFNNPMDIDLSAMTAGLSYILQYTVEKPGCPLDMSTIVLEAIAAPFAGDSIEVSLCFTDPVQDFNSLINEPSLLGTWNQVEGDNLGITDYNNVDFSSTAGGRYVFDYTVAGVQSCPDQVAQLIINLGSGTNAGDDNIAIVCKGDSIDVNTLLSTDAEGGGAFLVEGGFPLFNGIWDSNIFLQEEGLVNVQYVVEAGSPSCPSDTADFVITLIKKVTAGIPIQAIDTFCIGTSINLYDLLADEDSGGAFYIAPDFINSIPEDFTVTARDIDFAYLVDGGAACRPDTSFFTISSYDSTQIDLSLNQQTVCQNTSDCVQLNLNLNQEADINLFIANEVLDTIKFTRDRFGFNNYKVCFNGSLGSMSNDTLYAGVDAGIITLGAWDSSDSSPCTPTGADTTTISLQINPVYEQTFFGTVCEGSTTMVNGSEYGSSVREQNFTEEGCDSIINIIIDTFPFAVGMITDSFCAGTQKQLFNQVFVTAVDEYVVFPGQSVFGCDSAAQVVLTIIDKVVGTLDTMICEGDFINIDGMDLMDEGRFEIESLRGSTSGCDSSTVVNLGYFAEAFSVIDTSICTAGDSIVIDGISYFPGPTANTLAPIPSAQGCDSIIYIAVSEASPTLLQIDTFLCHDSTIEYGGVTYDINTLPDVLRLQDINGCDSLILDFTILDRIEDTMPFVVDTICNAQDIPIISIQSTGVFIPAEFYINGVLDTIVLDNSNWQGIDLEGQVGINTIEAIGKHGCSITRTFEIIPISDTLQVNILVSNTGNNSYELAYSSVLDPLSISWSGSAALSCVACESPTITISENTEVFLELSLEDGCMATTSVILEYDLSGLENSYQLYEPGVIAFDELNNDVFYLQSGFDFTVSELRIFDRWGNMVFQNEAFQSNDAAEGWDGRYNSRPVEQGVYIYQYTYDIPGLGIRSRSGHLTVIR